MPKMRKRHDMTHIYEYYYAHRGLHKKKSSNPENSLTAFKRAIENNYGIELDVQLSKDLIPVVYHDYNLRRVCGIDKKVCELTYDELRKLTLYSSNEKIPNLKEVLDLVNGKVPLIIELKIEDKDIFVCNVVATYLDDYNGVYCIESFNPLGLIWFKKNRPSVIRGQLSTNLLKDEGNKRKIVYLLLQNLMLNFCTKPDFIAFNYKYCKMISFVLCRAIYRVPTFAWTITSQEGIEDSKRSFDVFIFEKFKPKI
ncbi:glycerophosphodiester phosphodiesterase [Alkalibaculum sp. M08DMB]|uniref:Glycerophosphodiester phosphodiesterase n=2 Tax=Alkalibaculum sporogenes TaxID=2655001 RepID=A0A6A7KCK1_9FIRM|nr:glycerophosphodiester phosphodiesterase family protein [Alkalibaculum sporogenes]MPW27248.1 glycerophosphodiester phosphodiesterase [Alkalibaculum sporogenes]